MVKLSRRQVKKRSLRRRSSSRKSGKFMVGGDFTGEPGEFTRKESNINLYNLIYSIVDGKNEYILDFTKSETDSGGFKAKAVRYMS